MSSVDRELRISINTGRVYLGSKVVMREIRRGQAKIAIMSSNSPEEIRERVETYGRLSGIPVLVHSKDSVDLGILCGKPFAVSAIVINDLGDSKILDLVTAEDA